MSKVYAAAAPAMCCQDLHESALNPMTAYTPVEPLVALSGPCIGSCLQGISKGLVTCKRYKCLFLAGELSFSLNAARLVNSTDISADRLTPRPISLVQVLPLPVRDMSASRPTVHPASRFSMLTNGPNVSMTVHAGMYPLKMAVLFPAAVQLAGLSAHR